MTSKVEVLSRRRVHVFRVGSYSLFTGPHRGAVIEPPGPEVGPLDPALSHLEVKGYPRREYHSLYMKAARRAMNQRSVP